MGGFHEELCGCTKDFGVCLWAFCVPGGSMCVQASAVNKATGQGTCVPYLLVCCLACIGGAINRGKIRERYEIHGSFCADCMLWWCCSLCASCQEYREVHHREHHKA